MPDVPFMVSYLCSTDIHVPLCEMKNVYVVTEGIIKIVIFAICGNLIGCLDGFMILYLRLQLYMWRA